MTRIAQRLAAFLKDESGATATEYAVMLALIIVVCITAVSALGEKTSSMFVDIESAMP
ncbi:MAG: Flp family type IVb pilin [Planctomycetes bacterium]|nr:Flp family type IVb pilin [Planctomycetota bacterium]